MEEAVAEVPKAEAPAAMAVERPFHLQILLVEDDDDTRLVLTELLEACDYDVRPARNIAEAVAEVRERPFDLVISDLGLPDGSGLDMFVSLRSMRHLRGIALSGFGMEEDVRRSRSAGFAAHMTKPVTLQALSGPSKRSRAGRPFRGRAVLRQGRRARQADRLAGAVALPCLVVCARSSVG